MIYLLILGMVLLTAIVAALVWWCSTHHRFQRLRDEAMDDNGTETTLEK